MDSKELRSKQFQVGLFGQLKKAITESFVKKDEKDNIYRGKLLNILKIFIEEIRESVKNIKNNIFTVKVSNQIEVKDYTKELEQIKEEFRAIGEVFNNNGKTQVPYIDNLLKVIKEIDESIKKIKDNDVKKNLIDLLSAIKEVEKSVKNIKTTEIKENKIDIVPVVKAIKSLEDSVGIIKFPKFENKEIIQEIRSLRDTKNNIKTEIDIKPLIEAIKGIKEAIIIPEIPKIEFPKTISVDNFPPQRIPTPVTHFSINSLNGIVKTTAVTVTSTATLLPPTNLENRRSIIIYNNSENTIYLGNQDVTTSNGLPLPESSYSPAFDLGYNMTIYAICNSTADIRCLEISDEASGR